MFYHSIINKLRRISKIWFIVGVGLLVAVVVVLGWLFFRKAQLKEPEQFSQNTIGPFLPPIPSPKIGFDPGMKTARAAYSDPASPFYFESCPNETDGKCYGNVDVPAGSGFYTLSSPYCKINSSADDRFYFNEENPSVPCPYRFEWKNYDNSLPLIVNLISDTLSFDSGYTPAIYHGLQENPNVPYSGINCNNPKHCPKIQDIDEIRLKFRARLCSTQNTDTYRYGRITYYLDFWSDREDDGQSIAIDLLQYYQTPDGSRPQALVETIERESVLADRDEDDPSYHSLYNTIFVNSQYEDLGLDLVPQSSHDFFRDTSPNCIGVLDTEWFEAIIPVKELINEIKKHDSDFIDEDIYSSGKYSGGIIAGIEQWGRSLVELEVKEHTMYEVRPPAPTPIPTPTPPSTGSTIQIYAAGQKVAGVWSKMALKINGQNAEVFNEVKGDAKQGVFETFTYNHPTKVTPSQVRVEFLNDYWKPPEDRNLRVDKIVIDGTAYQTEAPNVYSIGVWDAATDCRPGNKRSEWLACNGYFQYSTLATPAPIPLGGSPAPDLGGGICIGDLNGDTKVSLADLNLFLGQWNTDCSSVVCTADFDGNGAVNLLDLQRLLNNFNKDCD